MVNVERFMAKINDKWKHSHNISTSLKSRILILWDSSHWSNIIIHTNDQFISCILHNANGTIMLCSMIYASNDEIKRKELWNYISKQSKKVNLLWIVAVDSNSILSPNERINDGTYNLVGDLDFNNLITYSNLVEPNFTSIFFHLEGRIKIFYLY